MAVAALTLAAGALLVVLTMGDAVATLVLTGGESARWRPTRLWYGGTWRLARGLAVRVLPPRSGELVLQAYPALSLLGLLLLWLVSLALGWALVYRGLGAHLDSATDWGDLLYQSGVSLLAPGQLGRAGVAVRLLGLLETVSGLGTIALLISYLPAMYGAYSRREALQLPLRDKEEAWQRLQALRTTYGVRLQQLIDFLVAPHGFWGHSAEAVVATEVARAASDALVRARRAATDHRRT